MPDNGGEEFGEIKSDVKHLRRTAARIETTFLKALEKNDQDHDVFEKSIESLKVDQAKLYAWAILLAGLASLAISVWIALK